MDVLDYNKLYIQESFQWSLNDYISYTTSGADSDIKTHFLDMYFKLSEFRPELLTKIRSTIFDELSPLSGVEAIHLNYKENHSKQKKYVEVYTIVNSRDSLLEDRIYGKEALIIDQLSDDDILFDFHLIFRENANLDELLSLDDSTLIYKKD